MRRSKPSVFLLILLLSATAITGLAPIATLDASPQEKEIGFIEEFALAADRNKALENLVPGTEAYYYYHALHYQTTEQLDKVDELLKPWEKKLGRTRLLTQIQNRQALLKYTDAPDRTLEYLRKKLNLNFDHQRIIPPAEQNLESKLDPKLLLTEKLIEQALSGSQNTNRVHQSALPLLATRDLNAGQTRHLLNRIQYPDFPNLVDLIARELKEKSSRGFGSIPIHNKLTLQQMDELAKRQFGGGKQLLLNSKFVTVYLSKLSPSNDILWLDNDDEKEIYYDRLEEFVSKLGPTFNSLKACVLYRQLELDQKRNQYNREKFLKYLQLPRRIGYINNDFIKRFKTSSHFVNFGANYQAQTYLRPIINDEPLVRDYLHHFLRDADDSSEFSTYIKDDYLKRQFATVKILNGIGDREKWAALLSPAQYQELIDRVDLEFARTCPQLFNVDDAVELQLHTKNIKNLIVRIFEVNTFNYYRRHQQEIDTDINLDGLVPNHELSFKYDDAPALRKSRTFKLDQIKDRGVYIVDFIGGGKSSRALIRKGQLQIIGRKSMIGHRLQVVDENAKPVPGAQLWIAGRRYVEDRLLDAKESDSKAAKDETASAEEPKTESESSLITVPFTQSPGRTAAIITHEGFSCLQTFQHASEQYQFRAAMYVDRESLIRSGKSQIMIRPRLTVANQPIPLARLSDIKLQISTINLDGNASTRRIADLDFKDDSEWVAEFIVPPRLKSVSFTVTAKTKRFNGGDEQVYASQSFSVNQIDTTSQIEDLHLLPTDKGYFLEVLGKTGERRPKRSVQLNIVADAVTKPVRINLQSDKDGLIELGKLENVRSINATLPDSNTRTWQLNQSNQTYYRSIHAVVGDTIEIPAPHHGQPVDATGLSLMEVRNNQFTHLRNNAISVADGLISIANLKHGDYLLRLKEQNRSIEIRVTEKLAKVNRMLVGKDRQLQSRGNRTLYVSNIETGEDAIKVSLGNQTAMTRVHVLATRYKPAFRAFDFLAQIPTVEPRISRPPFRPSVYFAGRKIGDEYQYILDRKYAAKYPGNMLGRPSLLNNPWAVRTTQNGGQNLASGNQYGGAGGRRDGKDSQAESEKRLADQSGDFSNLDFLGSGIPVLANLRPDEKGQVTIPRDALKNAQHIRIVVVNGSSTIQREVNLPVQSFTPTDSRLADVMDGTKHFTQTKEIEFLKAGDELKIEDIVSSRFQYFDDLAGVYRFYSGHSNNNYLKQFDFLLNWANLNEKQKQALYSEFACHELNFYLFKKDQEFFKSVVLTHLKNKRERTFMDHWLLNSDLEQYLKPWRFAQLNVVERILLATRMEDRGSDIIKHIDDLYRLNPTSRQTADANYEMAITDVGLSATSWSTKVSNEKLSRKFNQAFDESGASNPSGALFTGQGGQVTGGAIVSSDQGPANRPGKSSPARPAQQAQRDGNLAGEIAPPSFLAPRENSETNLSKKSGGRGRSKSDSLRSLGENQKNLENANGRWESRTRSVPATRTRTETKTRSVPVRRSDGSIEMVEQQFTVNVPYTEQVTQNYQVFVPYGDQGGKGKDSEKEFEEEFDEEQFRFSDLSRLGQRISGFYQSVRPTQEWVENNYYRLLPKQTDSNLVTANQFWRDFANHQSGPFFSSYFTEAKNSFTEIMFALAVLDLPMNGPEHDFDYADRTMTLTAKGPMLVFHQQVRPAVFDPANTTTLVSENFFQKNDRFRYEDGVRFDKFVSGEFLAHTLYGAQVVITNPTSTPRAVDLLVQIPEGAVACSSSQETRTVQMQLNPFSTRTMEYHFYFPVEGDYSHYPAHVSSKEKVLAVADPVAFKVVDRPAELDKKSWQFVSQNGSADQVIDFLNDENVLRLNLDLIAFRMKDNSFYQLAIETLRNRFVFNNTLWSYSILHQDKSGMRELLERTPQFVSACGFYFESPLLDISPFERKWYQHREYSPLINSRAHQVGAERKILNPELFSQYQRLLDSLANRRKLDDEDHLVVTYYLLLQDRIEEGLEHFDQVDSGNLPSKLQYDYCDAYLDLYREKPADAEKKAKRWIDYPVDHWRYRFTSLLAQVNEINDAPSETPDEKDPLKTGIDPKQTELAASSPTFDFTIDDGKAKLNYQNLKQIDVNIYEMDIELLFSRNPFAQDNLDGFTMIRPNSTQTIELAGDKEEFEFELPAEFKNKNVLVEISAGDQTKSRPYYANSLSVQISRNYGQLKVTKIADKKPLAKTYIKVYARTPQGPRFHKDGYTDLRGRFDYATQSNNPITGVGQFSILILHPEYGAIVRQVQPPQR